MMIQYHDVFAVENGLSVTMAPTMLKVNRFLVTG